MNRFRLEYTHKNWKREPKSPFATATITYAEYGPAQEKAMKLKAEGCHNIVIRVIDKDGNLVG